MDDGEILTIRASNAVTIIAEKLLYIEFPLFLEGDIMQRSNVITEVSGHSLSSIFKGQAAQDEFFFECLTVEDGAD